MVLLSAAVTAAALAVYFKGVDGAVVTNAPFHISWWGLAISFFLTEVYVVHLQFRRDAHSVSLSEIPLVLGLFFATPEALILGQVVGAAVALGLHRRQSLLKLLFNTSHLFL
ncbi:MAG: hypothetical protein ACRDJI_04090, partial [Actinomycetota bacterium]